MKISYQIEFEDYAEAYRVAAQLPGSRGTPRKTHLVVLVLAWILALGGIGMWMVILWRSLDAFDVRAGQIADSAGEIAPWIALAILLLAPRMTVQMRRRTMQASWLLLLVLIVAFAVFFLSHRSAPMGKTVIGWIGVLTVWAAFWENLFRATHYRRQWELHAHLFGQTELTWDAQGYEVRGDGYRRIYSWTRLKEWSETPNLLLLSYSRGIFDMVPKRAFPDSVAVDEFRQALINATQPTKPAFPVIPLPMAAHAEISPPEKAADA